MHKRKKCAYLCIPLKRKGYHKRVIKRNTEDTIYIVRTSSSFFEIGFEKNKKFFKKIWWNEKLIIPLRPAFKKGCYKRSNKDSNEDAGYTALKVFHYLKLDKKLRKKIEKFFEKSLVKWKTHHIFAPPIKTKGVTNEVTNRNEGAVFTANENFHY